MSKLEKWYRDMVRVIEVNQDNVVVVIPGWDSSEEIMINKTNLPAEVLEDIHPGYRYFAKVSLDVDMVEDIQFKHWEIPLSQEIKPIDKNLNKLYRNMVRVTKIEENTINVVIPGWDSSEEITIEKILLPKTLLNDMKEGYRYFAQVPLGVDTIEEMTFSGWEIPLSQEIKPIEEIKSVKVRYNK